jgi:hypothetical protein
VVQSWTWVANGQLCTVIIFLSLGYPILNLLKGSV